MSVRVRFAPSPTGYLHIGGARTALFNYLFAKHFNGKFLLRIEDTDRKRSTDEAINIIFSGLKWLGLDWDETPIYQFSRSSHHANIAKKMVENGSAYYCHSSPEEILTFRENAKAHQTNYHFKSPWRDKNAPCEIKGKKGVIRLKAPQDGVTIIPDLVQGEVIVPNNEIDDMVMLRSDETPTYMLAVVVDDHDMGITHIIRGDDHLTNAARQIQIYKKMNWNIPEFAHIPLIHGPDGAKLSKRHGAIPVNDYKEMGFLPEAMNNYLMRLGWSHGNDEIFSLEQAINWFDIKDVNRSPARFDMQKLIKLNNHYIKEKNNEDLVKIIHEKLNLNDIYLRRINAGINGLKERSHTLNELIDLAKIYLTETPFEFTNDEKKYFNEENISLLKEFYKILLNEHNWEQKYLLNFAREFVTSKGKKLAEFSQIIRLSLCGKTISPSIFEMLEAFGKEESLNRIKLIIETLK